MVPNIFLFAYPQAGKIKVAYPLVSITELFHWKSWCCYWTRVPLEILYVPQVGNCWTRELSITICLRQHCRTNISVYICRTKSTLFVAWHQLVQSWRRKGRITKLIHLEESLAWRPMSEIRDEAVGYQRIQRIVCRKRPFSYYVTLLIWYRGLFQTIIVWPAFGLKSLRAFLVHNVWCNFVKLQQQQVQLCNSYEQTMWRGFSTNFGIASWYVTHLKS